MKSFLNRGFRVEGEASVDFCGDLSGDDFQNLLSKFDEQAVEGGIHLLVNVFALLQSALWSDDRILHYQRDPCRIPQLHPSTWHTRPFSMLLG